MKIKSMALLLSGAALCMACTPGAGSNDKENAKELSFSNEVDSVSYVLGMGYSAPMEELEMVLANSGSDKAFVDQLIKGIKDGVRGGDKEKLAYFIGLRSGMNMRTEIIGEAESQLFGEDTAKHLNLDKFIAGFMDVANNNLHFKVGEDLLLPRNAADYVQCILDQTFVNNQRKAYPKEFEENTAFMKKKSEEAGLDSLEGGIYYKVIKPGRGPKPSEGNIVSIEFEGRLIDGLVITKSHAITDVAVKNGILNFPGFTKMVTNMPLGAEWEAYIPWTLCYGASGNSDIIPPFSNIIFRVKLHNIK